MDFENLDDYNSYHSGLVM